MSKHVLLTSLLFFFRPLRACPALSCAAGFVGFLFFGLEFAGAIEDLSQIVALPCVLVLFLFFPSVSLFLFLSVFMTGDGCARVLVRAIIDVPFDSGNRTSRGPCSCPLWTVLPAHVGHPTPFPPLKQLVAVSSACDCSQLFCRQGGSDQVSISPFCSLVVEFFGPLVFQAASAFVISPIWFRFLLSVGEIL